MIDLNAIAEAHHPWVERMGWHNITVLESLALIASEIGEAGAESLGGMPYRDRFGEELADVILRCADLSKSEGIDLNAAVAKVGKVRWHAATPTEAITEILVDHAKWTNSTRKTELGPEFAEGLGRVVARVIDLAKRCGVDLTEAVRLKMALNNLRGTRGRPF